MQGLALAGESPFAPLLWIRAYISINQVIVNPSHVLLRSCGYHIFIGFRRQAAETQRIVRACVAQDVNIQQGLLMFCQSGGGGGCASYKSGKPHGAGPDFRLVHSSSHIDPKLENINQYPRKLSPCRASTGDSLYPCYGFRQQVVFTRIEGCG
ncbi:uncharacterized protein EI90DRAFT_1600381 [Cantharellus anzutake]|uniref:uncharacterized protein n=1 Tax=Cantharellus anzutake TaxID=1750568 RepID=UPI001903009A|nr:uncharacterized protein EI90DRAFT_1600381 [Cantharellus anzutake]KAF8328113.1 hypothetical protein EI90DRAFT_1600381 [Cantharellus anzutake]